MTLDHAEEAPEIGRLLLGAGHQAVGGGGILRAVAVSRPR